MNTRTRNTHSLILNSSCSFEKREALLMSSALLNLYVYYLCLDEEPRRLLAMQATQWKAESTPAIYISKLQKLRV